jgi:hypothetical protein
VKSTERLWSALENAGALSGVRAAWARELHEDLDVLVPFLRPRPGLVECYPCDFPGDGCPREVICHGPDEMVAVCRSTEIECETLRVTKADLVSYELDLLKLGSALRGLLTIGGPEPTLDGELQRTVVLGSIPGAGQDARAYFALPDLRAGEEPQIVAERLLVRHPGRFLLLLPSEKLLSPITTMMLGQRQARVLWLSEITGIEDASLVLKDPSITNSLWSDPRARSDQPSFVRQGSCYVVSFRGKSAAFPLLEGMADLGILFMREGESVPSKELAVRLEAATRKVPTVAAVDVPAPLPVARGRKGSDSDLVLDKKARKNLANAIAEYRESGRIEEAEDLEAHLRKAIDITGKTRHLGSRRDQDRINVSKRIKLALELVKRDLPELYEHLGGENIFSRGKIPTTLRVGAYCSYSPPTPMTWEVRA